MMELLISWCVTSSILVAVFLLLRGTLFRKLSPRVRYALWGVVLLRLLVPFQIPSLSLPASAADLAPELPVLSNRPLSPDTAMGHAVIPSGLLEENGLTIADDGTVQASQSGQDAALWELQENGEVYMYFGGPTLDDVLRAAVVMVWAAGAGGVLLAVLAANLRFAQKLRRSRRPLPTAGCPLPVYEAEGLSSPCLCGVLRPAVYLTPEAAEDGTVRTHVLAHELTHFRHRDHIWSLLRCLALPAPPRTLRRQPQTLGPLWPNSTWTWISAIPRRSPLPSLPRRRSTTPAKPRSVPGSPWLWTRWSPTRSTGWPGPELIWRRRTAPGPASGWTPTSTAWSGRRTAPGGVLKQPPGACGRTDP